MSLKNWNPKFSATSQFKLILGAILLNRPSISASPRLQGCVLTKSVLGRFSLDVIEKLAHWTLRRKSKDLAYIYICIFVYIYILYVYVYVYIYICMCVYMYIHILYIQREREREREREIRCPYDGESNSKDMENAMGTAAFVFVLNLTSKPNIPLNNPCSSSQYNPLYHPL